MSRDGGLRVILEGDENDILDFLEACHPDNEAAREVFEELAVPMPTRHGVYRLELDWEEVPGR